MIYRSTAIILIMFDIVDMSSDHKIQFVTSTKRKGFMSYRNYKRQPQQQKCLLNKIEMKRGCGSILSIVILFVTHKGKHIVTIIKL